MSARPMLASVPHHLLRWVRDGSGVAHAVRQAEGEHCSCHCRKYVRGDWFMVEKGEPVRFVCPDCELRLENPVSISPGPSVPRCVLMGHGVQNELRRRAKGRD